MPNVIKFPAPKKKLKYSEEIPKDWPIPMHSSQDEEIKKMLAEGRTVQLKYLATTDGGFVAEQNPEHEKRREQREREGKARL